jgi:hypothetical protein
MKSDHEITRDHNHENYINNILYSMIKCFASKHISVISLLSVYSKCEIKKYIWIIFFRKKLIREAVNAV